MVSSNDYLTLIQHFKHKMEKTVYTTAKYKSPNWQFSLQIQSPFFVFDLTQTVAALFVSLRHWSSSFFVAGWQAFGISLAWVEHLRALFQFWSDHILHCHLEWGKLKQPFPFFFFLWITNREFFNELDMISVSFYVTVCLLRVYLRHCMVAVGMFYFSLRSISFWEWKKKPKLHWFFLGSVIGPENSRHYAIRDKIKTNHDLVALVFPRFRHSRCLSLFWLLGRFWL